MKVYEYDRTELEQRNKRETIIEMYSIFEFQIKMILQVCNLDFFLFTMQISNVKLKL